MLKKLLFVPRKLLLVGVVFSLWLSPPAMATPHHPTGDFAIFADCPLNNPETTLCMSVRITSGEIVLGHRIVPISRPLRIQGGLAEHGEGLLHATVVGAEDGQTLVKTQLQVPGGLLALPGKRSSTEVSVTPELVSTPDAIQMSIANLLKGTGVAMGLSLKAKLNSRLLPSECQVGSAADPIQLSLTTGTTSPPSPNKPITGISGEAQNAEEGNGALLVMLTGNAFVDNAFSVPGAIDCGITYTSLVDSSLGIPASAGRNTAVLEGDVQLATIQSVKASE
jgi:hypothetical protein